MDNPGRDTESFKNGSSWSKYPIQLWRMIATWWRSYRSWDPDRYTWGIGNFGNISIVRESSGNYLASITTTLTYINTDDRGPLAISPILIMYIPHIGSGREGDSYKLTTPGLGIQQIPPDVSLNLEHTFSMRTGAPPLLSGTAKCIVRGNVTGEMKLPAGVIKGTLKLDGTNTFDTKVAKEWIRE